jgi:hypothetical protein
MAGGIFPGKPFAFNLKCIIFTAVLAGGYWYLPHKNLWVLLFLLWFPYIALAWYDYGYDCKNKLEPTVVPFGRLFWLPFKPPGYKDEFDKMEPEKIAVMDKVDHLTGWTIVVLVAAFVLKNKLFVKA